MHKNKVLKQLLAVSAVASMFASIPVYAQSSANTTPSVQELNQINTGTTNMDGKTARDGTVGNTNSQGMDERVYVRYQQGTGAGTSTTQGSTGATGTAGHDMTGQSSTGSSTTGATGSSGQGTAGQSSTGAGTTGSTGSAGHDMTGQSSTGSSTSGTTGTSGQDMSGQSSTGASTTGATGTAGQDMQGQTSSGAAATGQTSGGAASGKLNKADQRILMDMARANIAEIEAGKLALSKTQDDHVKAFAQQMIDDHGKALSEVQALGQARGVTLPTEPDKKHKAMAAKMEKLSGDAFNREYMKQAGVSDHKMVYSLLQKHHKNAKDPEVKALAGKMLPTVEQHLKSAQQMATAKNGTTSGK